MRPRSVVLRRRRLSLAAIAVATVVTVVLLAVVGLSGSPRRGGTAARPGVHGTSGSVSRIVAPSVSVLVRSAVRFPGTPAKLPFPSGGQGAVAVDGIGVIGASPKERPVPIASVTKIMTAVVVLQDHPLRGSEGGPVLTMTPADHQAWIEASEDDDSNVEVVAGERIDERQLLEALLIPSADNVADILAEWDAGSVAAFVVKMNEEAAKLGLGHTQYADASGLDPRSRSTAHDLVILAGYAMRNLAFREIVDNVYVDLPVAGRVWNYNPAIGVDGIVGVKSGFTDAAGGCLVTAAWRSVGGRRVLVVSAALGQVLGLYEAATVDEAMLQAATSELQARTVLTAGQTVGRATAQWDHRSTTVALDPAAGPVVVVGWPGLVVSPALNLAATPASRLQRGWPAGCVVGTLEVSAPAGPVVSVPAVLTGALPAPPGSGSGHSS